MKEILIPLVGIGFGGWITFLGIAYGWQGVVYFHSWRLNLEWDVDRRDNRIVFWIVIVLMISQGATFAVGCLVRLVSVVNAQTSM